MGEHVTIGRFTLPAVGFERLATEARGEGHGFLDRMTRDWDDGSNRFERPGERLLAVSVDATLIAVGGLNIDPYAGDPGIGRLRHVFVAGDWRRRGIASMLVQALIAPPLPFKVVRLRAAGFKSARLYEALGFTRVDEPAATHRRKLL